MGFFDDLKKSFSELGDAIRNVGKKADEAVEADTEDEGVAEVENIRKKLERFGRDEDKPTEEKPDVVVDDGEHD